MAKGSAARSAATFSVIGADVVVTGNINATVDLHIDGSVEGDIACAAVIQGEGSRITGSIVADSARLSGMVDGSITARELIIARTAHVTGDIAYESISIETGGVVEGRFTVRGGAALLTSEHESQLKLVSAAPAA
ncbi:bactofilin family protein [Sphingomonas cavernae]|uniref:bactofilin family protein n=1 Tax=Sphingomonas cavernae TaxID=2320861 RepID=UPI001EE60094|nr:polymer-forming cytoskeletal protein [Sphingomonas cavernae]